MLLVIDILTSLKSPVMALDGVMLPGKEQVMAWGYGAALKDYWEATTCTECGNQTADGCYRIIV